jgi:hypothetical protein
MKLLSVNTVIHKVQDLGYPLSTKFFHTKIILENISALHTQMLNGFLVCVGFDKNYFSISMYG